jgi:hypothetical protein
MNEEEKYEPAHDFRLSEFATKTPQAVYAVFPPCPDKS